MPTAVIPFGASAGVNTPIGSAIADATGAATVTASAARTEIGNSLVYTVVIQLPLPFVNLNLNLNLLGDFILPALTALGIPKAVFSFTSRIQSFFDNIITDAQILIRAIPEATVRIVVKVGPATVVNILLVAEKVPMVITPPTFKLAIPNLIADANLNLAIPIDGQTVTIRVPIPVPIINPVPLLTVTGGQVSASASSTTSVTPDSGAGGFTSGAFAATSPAGAAGAGGVVLPTIEDPIVVTDI